METIYLIVPLTILLLAVMVGGLLWAIRSDQFEDLEGPGFRLLMDDDSPEAVKPPEEGERKDEGGGVRD